MHADLTSLSLPGALGWSIGMQEMIVLAVFGLLIFGKRLPEVGKSLGKSIVEFKKGLHGVEDEINNATSSTPDMLPPPQQTNQTQATPEVRSEPNSVPRS